MAVLHGDAEAIAITLLSGALAAPVHSKIPKSRPASFVTVRRTGGPARDVVVDDAQLTISSWAADSAAAQDLAQLARQALHSAAEAGTGSVRRVQEFSGPYRDPDDQSKHERYSQTFAVALRA